MDSNRAIELLNRQIENSKPLSTLQRYSPEFKKWHRDTEVAIERIFGKGARHVADFTKVTYSLSITSSRTTEAEHLNRYTKGLETARQILTSMVEELKEFGPIDSTPEDNSPFAYGAIFEKFHLVARQLRARHGQRPTLEIEDEYDVQDLLHALLLYVADDIRKEEWTPSYAGGSSRADFLMKQHKTIVEVKKTRKDLTARDIGDQLIVDIARYQSHPDCEKLVCFVYDPEGRIGNPVGLENDLSKRHGNLLVTVIVAPRGR